MIRNLNVRFGLAFLGLAGGALLARAAIPLVSPQVEAPATVPAEQTLGRIRLSDRAIPEPLPDAARQVSNRLVQETAAAQSEMQRRIDSQRQAAIAQLETLVELYTATAKPEQAGAVRQEIERIQSLAQPTQKISDANTLPRQPLPAADWVAVAAPRNLIEFRNSVGQSFTFLVTGAAEGSVWGTDIYTDDSAIGAAAVHAGLLKPGEQRALRLKITPAADSFSGSTRSGVTSTSYVHWDGGFQFLAADDATASPSAAEAIQALRGHEDAVLLLEVTGSTVGTIWGDTIYTDDSPLEVAAVHAGLLRSGQRGLVRVVIRPAQDAYLGAEHNGIVSRPYPRYVGSYQVMPYAADPSNNIAPLTPAPALPTLREKVGESLYIRVTGSAQGTVWGTDVYTDDSPLATAAVHAGVLRDDETGIVKVTIARGEMSYAGTARNGVTSQNYQVWNGSFRIERAAAGFTPPTLYGAPANGMGPFVEDNVERLGQKPGLIQDIGPKRFTWSRNATTDKR